MALVLNFPTAEVAPAKPALVRVRRMSAPLSTLFGSLFWLAAVVCLALGLAVLAHEGPWLQIRDGTMLIRLETDRPPLAPGWTTVGDLPIGQRLAMIGSGLLMMGPALAVLWTLRRLFSLYAAGVVLEPRNARCFTVLACWMIAYAAGPTLGHVLVETSGLQDRGWLRLDSLQALGLGLVLFVIGWIMRLAAEARANSEAFV